MNDRPRNVAIEVIAAAGSALFTLSVILFSGTENVAGLLILVFMTGTRQTLLGNPTRVILQDRHGFLEFDEESG
ncbi:MAG TPA: hypothetical protein VHO48_11990 [Anaerolineaceae bacterium]|nr:hypothetical protein [Anaerolineaceae bacterium]